MHMQIRLGSTESISRNIFERQEEEPEEHFIVAVNYSL